MQAGTQRTVNEHESRRASRQGQGFSEWGLRRTCRDHGTRWDQRLPYRIDPDVQAFEGTDPEQGRVARFPEYDEVRRLGPAGSYERVADTAVDAASVRHDKALRPFHDYSKAFQDVARNPGVLASGVDQRVGQRPRRLAPVEILDLYGGAKKSHVVHGSTVLPER